MPPPPARQPSAQLTLGFAWGLFDTAASDKDRLVHEDTKAIMVCSDGSGWIDTEVSKYISLHG